MWSIVEGPKVVKNTKSLTRTFKEMQPCPADRKLREDRAAYLRNVITEGQFRTCEWASCYCKETETEYRVNGKHTSTVLSELNGYGDGIPIVVTRFTCDTLEDLAKLYSSFDTRSSARSVGDINRVYASSNSELISLSTDVINLCVSGMAYELWEESYTHHPPEDRAVLLLTHPDFVVWVSGIFTDPEAVERKHLRRASVTAAMFRTYKKAQGKSTEFWKLVRDGDCPDCRSADRTLNRYLLSVSVFRGLGASVNGKKKAGNREIYVKCIHAWNAWRRGEKTDLKFYAGTKTPAAV